LVGGLGVEEQWIVLLEVSVFCSMCIFCGVSKRESLPIKFKTY